MGKWECRRRALLGGGESAIHADGPASDPTLSGRKIRVQGNMTGLLKYATLFSTNANDFLLTAPVGDTGEGASVDATAAARAFCGGGGDICGEMETSPRPGITAQDFLLAPPTPLTELKGFSF